MVDALTYASVTYGRVTYELVTKRSVITGHQAADLGAVGATGGHLGHDPASVDDGDPVGQRQDLVELGRDQEHGGPGVARLDDPPVDELDRPDVDAAGGLRRHEQARPERHLAGDDDLLLVATRQRPR